MKSYQENQELLTKAFLYHRAENGLNFLQADFVVNKIAKIMVGLGL